MLSLESQMSKLIGVHLAEEIQGCVLSYVFFVTRAEVNHFSKERKSLRCPDPDLPGKEVARTLK